MPLYEFRIEDALDFSKLQGIPTFQKGNELHFKTCPYCHGGRNHDKNTFSINLTTGLFNCKRASCNAHGSMITLASDFDLSLGRDADEYYRIKPGHFRTIKKQLSEDDVTDTAITYLTGRSIPEEIVKRYRITSQKEHPDILVFPFYEPDGKRISFIKYRNTAPKEGQHKEWCEANCKPILFGMDQCNMEDKTLIMTEGQIDTLSVVAAGYQNCVSVPTGKNGFTWVPHCWDWLQSFDKLIVFGDHEHNDITLLEPMQGRFSGQVFHIREEDYRDCKDANDILRKYGVDGIQQCIENAERVVDPTIMPLSQVKEPDWDSIKCVPTGFEDLDKVIGGLYMGGLFLITGERGNGKSTFASQLLAKALRKGETIYAYSGELPAWQFRRWLNRQLSSGNGLIQKTINGREDYILTKGMQEKLSRFYKDRAYLYCADDLDFESTERNSIIRSVEKAIKQYGCTVVLIDNLMSALDDPGQDINWAQTAFVKKLANMARLYNVCVILLAHPRKSNVEGRELSSDDIMGSGNITNLATTVLAYGMPKQQFYLGQEGGRPDRVISVLKNRNFGDRLTGPDAICTWFDPVTKRISTAKGDFEWPDDEEPSFEEVEHDETLPF